MKDNDKSSFKLTRRQVLLAASAAGLGSSAQAKQRGDRTSPGAAGKITAEQDQQAPDQFDYVIVGGGTAGLVMASRLSEDPRTSVLVLEAGGENTIENGAFAAGVGAMWGPSTNWGFMSAKQDQLSGRSIMQPRGKVLGGSAAINVGSWSRGYRGNYESWELPDWDWPTILETYRSIERSQKPNTELRGTKGRMHLEDTPAGSEMTDVFRRAAMEAGVGVTSDRNAADPTGFDLWETIFPEGRRWNTENGYLNIARKRSNLNVVTNAHVLRINFRKKRAESVSYVTGSTRHTAQAAREIVLCAGAINSPHLLKLSGIGPADELIHHGINVVRHHPHVGANLADHLRVEVGALAPPGVGRAVYADPGDPDQMALWRSGGYGPLTVAENTSAAFVRVGEAQHPNIEFMYAINPPMGLRKDHPDRAGWYIMVGLVQPKSTGAITLASADPMDKAVYDPGYLTHPDDIKTYVEGTRLALQHVRTKALSRFTDPATLTLPVDASDSAIETHIRNTAESIYHPVGSVRMGRDNDATAPLDTQCRLKGVDGLRVVDASSIPSLVSGHTMAPTIMIAERVAQMMKSTSTGTAS